MQSTTTPGGTPPQDFIGLAQQKPSNGPAPTPDTSQILKALAVMAQQSTTAPPTTSGIPAPGSSINLPSAQIAFPQNVSSSVNQVPPVAPPAQAVNVPGGQNFASQFAAQFAGMTNAAQTQNPNQTSANVQHPLITSMLSAPTGGIGPETLQQLQLLQLIQAQGLPQDQWGTVLALLMSGNAGAGAGVANSNNALAPAWAQAGGQTAWAGRNEAESRDRNGYGDNQYMRSPPSRYHQPSSRSRSPPTWDRRRDQSPPRRRDSPVYGEYSGDRNGTRSDGYDRRGRGKGSGQGQGRGGGYRQRSPDNRRRSLSPLPPPGPKWVDYDYSIGEGMIKGKQPFPSSSILMLTSAVLSRTLFVGGVT